MRAGTVLRKGCASSRPKAENLWPFQVDCVKAHENKNDSQKSTSTHCHYVHKHAMVNTIFDNRYSRLSKCEPKLKI